MDEVSDAAEAGPQKLRNLPGARDPAAQAPGAADTAAVGTGAAPGAAAPGAAEPDAFPSVRRRSPGSLEEEVLGVLHRAGELSPGEVRALLPDSERLSYSAVVTTLTRLHAKGVVTRRRRGRGYIYSSPGDAATLVAWRMNRLLAGQSDHRPALTHFIAALSPTDEALVRDLLASAPAPAEGEAPGTGSPAPAVPAPRPAAPRTRGVDDNRPDRAHEPPGRS